MLVTPYNVLRLSYRRAGPEEFFGVEKTLPESIRHHFRPLKRRRSERSLRGIKSAQELRTIMIRERCRVDRNSHVFSMVFFGVDQAGSNGPPAPWLAEVLTRRMRAADEAGWFDKNHIAVVLDHTDADGAWKFARDVCDLVEAKAVRPDCRVTSYSSAPSDNDDDDLFGGRRQTDRLSPASMENNSRHSASGTTIARLSDAPEPSVAALPSPQRKPVERLEPYIAKKVPTYKRLMDIIGASIGIALLAPLFLLVSIIIKIVSPGPVFFRQERVGHQGKTFRMWKFRTMTVGADQKKHQEYVASLIKNGSEKDQTGQPMQKLKNDSRIIPLGNLLRKSCIDELPQLFNVLVGEMSLIGPRPPIPYEVQEYQLWHRERFDVEPGMTGLWQVSGKNKTTFKEMIRFDINYARQLCWRLDARILAGTIPAIISQVKDAV